MARCYLPVTCSPNVLDRVASIDSSRPNSLRLDDLIGQDEYLPVHKRKPGITGPYSQAVLEAVFERLRRGCLISSIS